MVRLKDIAEESGFSVGTVSKVLNGTQGNQQFGEECIERIRQAARKLGYVPNYHARSLQTGRAHALGLVLSSSSLHQEGWEHFWALMIRGIFDRAREMGYHVVSVTTTETDAHDPVDVGIQFLQERRIDALIVPPFDEVLHRTIDYPKALGPVILIDQPQVANMPGVDLDGSAGIRKGVAHLAQLGHRHILWLGPNASYNRTVPPRHDAFHRAAEDHGLSSEDLTVDFQLTPDKETLRERIAKTRRHCLENARLLQRATGAICYEESLALGLYAAAPEIELSIPGDLSVIGFDDIFASIAWPPMTVVSHMLPQLGAAAVEMAVQRIDNPEKENIEEMQLLEAELVIRESTAAPRK